MVVVIRLFQKQAAKGLQPLGQYFADGNQGAVLINCRFCEPVFVVEKMGFVTLGQNFGEVCESLLVSAAYICFGNVVASVADTVGNAV